VPKKFKTKGSAGKVTRTVFWNTEGVALSDFLEKGAMVNSEKYTEIIQVLQTLHHEEGGRY
jgi:hypothetical protein